MRVEKMLDAGSMLAKVTRPLGPDETSDVVLDDPAELDRVVITRPFPPQIASTYSARVAGPEGITLLDATECWIYQHGLRHMGEIELARGLVGLNGMTS